MNNVYRITGSNLDEDRIHNEFTVVMVGNDIKRVLSSFLDRFPDAEVLMLDRMNYAGEEVFDVI
ncbi:MAG: hypothetical protein ABFC34_03630 [Methanobacterium sp.]